MSLFGCRNMLPFRWRWCRAAGGALFHVHGTAHLAILSNGPGAEGHFPFDGIVFAAAANPHGPETGLSSEAKLEEFQRLLDIHVVGFDGRLITIPATASSRRCDGVTAPSVYDALQ